MNRRAALRSLAGPLGAAAFFALVTVGMSGCFTGERPTLAHEASTGSAAVDAVIEQVNDLNDAVYTAEYDAVVAFDNRTTDVVATQAAPGRRALTVGDVRYVVDGTETRTCTVSTGECVDRIDPARVSDVQMTPDFFGTSLAARIRRDAEIATAAPTSSTEQIQGQTAECVSIPIDADPVTYCVLSNGVLARLDAADLDVTMTSYATTADESQFTA